MRQHPDAVGRGAHRHSLAKVLELRRTGCAVNPRNLRQVVGADLCIHNLSLWPEIEGFRNPPVHRYDCAMHRFAARQSDLFDPAAEPQEEPDPLVELGALLTRLRAATRMPWADAAGAMADEQYALGLARRAGAAGEAFVAAILRETERLLAAAE